MSRRHVRERGRCSGASGAGEAGAGGAGEWVRRHRQRSPPLPRHAAARPAAARRWRGARRRRGTIVSPWCYDSVTLRSAARPAAARR
eukprot:1195953-Prorocentrum_minimum.AAC.2